MCSLEMHSKLTEKNKMIRMFKCSQLWGRKEQKWLSLGQSPQITMLPIQRFSDYHIVTSLLFVTSYWH